MESSVNCSRVPSVGDTGVSGSVSWSLRQATKTVAKDRSAIRMVCFTSVDFKGNLRIFCFPAGAAKNITYLQLAAGILSNLTYLQLSAGILSNITYFQPAAGAPKNSKASAVGGSFAVLLF